MQKESLLLPTKLFELREVIEAKLRREAALEWIEELDAKYGRATPEEQADNEAFLNEIGFGEPPSKHVAGAAHG